MFCLDNMNKIKTLQKKMKCYDNFTVILDDTQDKQAINNFTSLIKGGAFTVSSLTVTGGINIGGDANINVSANITGNTTTNGHLTVKNSSDFYGGNHIFRDAESKNGEWVRIGNPWGHLGIYASEQIYVGDNPKVIGNINIGDGRVNSDSGNLFINNNRAVLHGTHISLNSRTNSSCYITDGSLKACGRSGYVIQGMIQLDFMLRQIKKNNLLNFKFI